MRKLYFIIVSIFTIAISNAQIINFPDANLKAKLLAASPTNTVAANLSGDFFKIDTNSDNEIELSEALQVKFLNIASSNIVFLTGLQSFTNLQKLDCQSNQIMDVNLTGLVNIQQLFCNNNLLTSLNVSNLINLTQLVCSSNQLISIDLGISTALELLDCRSNQLPSINLNGLINLTDLYCGGNLLSSIDLSGLNSLLFFYCDFNQLEVLNVNNLTSLLELNCNSNNLAMLDATALVSLQKLSCRNNLLTSLDLTTLGNLQRLDCNNNLLSEIDVSGISNVEFINCGLNHLTSLNVNTLLNLQQLYCNNNFLTSLFSKNGVQESIFNFSGNPNMEYICVDDAQIPSVENAIVVNGYTNCHVNNYCSFEPGGTFYTIQGNSKFDFDNNGCTASDINYPNLKLSFTNNALIGTLIPDSSGHYRYDVQAGVYLVTPQLENFNYFSILPTPVTVNFPAIGSPLNLDFCITANGIHPDVEIEVVPLINAMAGNDARYKIIYKNKGTTVQNGLVNLNFNDSKIDFVSASPNISSQLLDNLNWSFSNLLPFETREIVITLNINSPSETPSVNGGDILNYTATILGDTDETPLDNTSILNQMVINSFDPNDKSCLEGTTITPEMVGKEIHYMIRFENTGTASAQSIVVKDIINLSEFAIDTLIPIDGSAPFVTKITGNQVEFIFENINLPFAAGTNDGYIAFKIKTKPTLIAGDSFSNTANIYFDYNAPIITNTATTNISILATKDFEFANYFTIYPNPANDVLNVQTKGAILVTSASIYNVLGQLVLAVPNSGLLSKIDVSELKSGNYFIKVNSDKGSSNAKFIKR